jgi:hypothetical protein
MRKTSFGLGLAGTIVAFVIGIIVLIFGIATTAVSNLDWDEITDDMSDIEITIEGEDFNMEMMGDYGVFPGGMFGAVGIYLIIGAVGLIIAGILGIVGTVITRKKQSVAAGVLLIVAAVLSIISLWGLFATALFTPSGVLAFIKEKKAEPIPPAPAQSAL